MIKLRPMRVSDSTGDLVTKCHVCALYYHRNDMVFDEGHWYCQEDHDWRFTKKRLDEARIEIKDDPQAGR